MGPSRQRGTVLLFGLLFSLVILGLNHQIKAEKTLHRDVHKEGNSDLVFDDKSTLSSTNHDRISPLSPPPSDTPLSPPDWLSNTLHRVKRGLFDFFGNSEENNNGDDDGDDTTLSTPTTDSTTIPGGGQRRRGDSGSQEEDDDYDLNHNGRGRGSQEEAEDELNGDRDEENDLGDDYEELGKKSFESAYVSGTKNSDRRQGYVMNSDDEDLPGSGDIGGHSGSHSGGIPSSSKIVFFRISITTLEIYQKEYEDRNSPQFKAFARNVTQSIQRIYESLGGIQTATVVKISKEPDDQFQSRVTIDLGSKDFYDQEKIKMKLLDHIKDSHTFDNSIQVSTKNFKFVAFGENEPPLLPDCAPHQLQCNNGECIDVSSRCNGIIECADGSDEDGCDCAMGELICDISRCIPDSQMCDGVKNCEDGTDEQDCPARCRSDQFTCDDNSCIENYKRCDGSADCPRAEDELHCTHKEYRCASDEISCGDGSCIRETAKCDGNYDCPDYSDEKNCPCKPDQFECGNSYCISMEQRCDGIHNCQDKSDEIGCKNTSACRSHEWRCLDGTCVDQLVVCNRHRDCADGSDEARCCKADEFRCSNHTCLSPNMRCDGVADCPHSEDEENCVICKEHHFRCQNGECIDERNRCNGRADCSDNSDEENCSGRKPPLRCQFDYWLCHDNRNCILPERRCDGVRYDCQDNSDELNCPVGKIGASYRPQAANISQTVPQPPAPPHHACAEGEFRCTDNGRCISLAQQCDDFDDCDNGSDEENCSGPDDSLRCTPDEFECDPGECIPITRRCDGETDCANNRDEYDCTQVRPRCNPATQFQCRTDGACIPLHGRCDGTVQCRDLSDEHECGCRQNQFTCRSTSDCVSNTQRCDRRRDCPDGSDEEACEAYYPPLQPQPDPAHYTCPSGQQLCRSGGQCLPYAAWCDGRMDCNDLSDEENCAPAYVPTTTTEEPPTRVPVYEPPVQLRCDWGHFRCENGPCIRQELKCNGRVDCPHDSSDELDCDNVSGRDGLNLRTYPSSQEILESIYKPGREVVFQCRDEGPIRARVHWTRANGLPLPPGSRDTGGRLEMPNIQVSDSGAYVCSALGYPQSAPGSMVRVNLTVDPYIPPTSRPLTACNLYEATCSNGDCIPKEYVCDGKIDCNDGSDESRCSPHGCEPNEFRCRNKRCVLKTWQCDSQDDCEDGSDEEECDTRSHDPGASNCSATQYSCHSGNMCIPKSFHCDGENDCSDNSDEIGCAKPVISRPPPPMVQLDIGALFEVSCTVVGIPIPEVVWRLNWGHVPAKCSYVSVNGVGTLTCPDIQEEDQGAYSCEAINIKGRTFAIPDTILVVNPRRTTCPRGSFNEEAVLPSDCLSCFCFGVTTDCRSADLFTYQLQPPFDSHNYVAVHVDSVTGVPDIRDTSSPQQLFRGSAPPRLTPLSRNSVNARYNPVTGPTDIIPYFALPENHLGNQLKSYGGYVKYILRVEGGGRRPINAPDVIISGNGYTLIHTHSQSPTPSVNTTLSVRFFLGEWLYRTDSAPERLATREEIMMALADVRHILIRLQYSEGVVDTTLTNVEMDSAGVTNTGLGQANLVEECRCPVGYSGLSCENCGSGFSRHRSGPWLGQCFKEVETCPPGTYGDPSRGITCQTCPCPLTHPTNQFGRTCSLDPDGDVTCDCPPGYVGRRCEKCEYGYTGNPLIPGDYCKLGSICNANGSVSNALDVYGQCHCKDYADGPTCDQCKPNTFFLNRDNQFGCIACFCMGITQECTSSNYYRNSISTGFTNSINDFKLIRLEDKQTPIISGIHLDQQSREIVYSDFRQADTYYWTLPSRFLGDKVTSYGGNLRYALRYVPIPGGQSSRNNAPDVELISENHINLLYFAREQNPAPDSTHSFVVPMLEQFWQRSDGQKADREHLLMALADLKAILIKASYTTNTREAALQSVSLDIAEERNTGSYERASAVEQCHCPVGYTGLSCEDCDAGYTRSTSGLYLGLCQPCFCNGNSNDCDPETGACFNCRSHTDGENCDRCKSGYVGDPTQREPCRPGDNTPGVGGSNVTVGPCDCDAAGTQPGGCIEGQCLCKTNVEGYRCDRCRDGTFGLSASLSEGCQSCFCSGIVTECRSSDLYIQQIPSQIIDESQHGFTLTDQYHRQPISSHFQLNVGMNEIGYVFRPSNTDRLFWSLPTMFTGNRIKSYGGKLEYTQRFTERPDAQYNIDQDVIISGNGVTIFWTNTGVAKGNISNRIPVPISTTAKWQRASHHAGPRPASREDLMRVLADVDYILIRAKPSSDTASTFISDITLDTAVETFTGQDRAIGVEVCRCTEGYRGTSCEQCKPGYYRDVNDVSRGPLGSCTVCPCSRNSQGCSLSPENEIDCICTPGWTGRLCENAQTQPGYPGPIINDPNRPSTPTISITITSPPNLRIQSIGSTVRYTCSARSTNPNPVRLYWSRSNGELPSRAVDDTRGILVITDLRVSDSGTYVCHASDGVSVNVKEVELIVGPNEQETPRVSIQPSYVQVHVDEPIDLTCSAVGNPTPYLQWNRKDGQLLNERHTFHNGHFHISNALATDQGVYECTAQNGAGYDRLDTTVYVLSRTEPNYPPLRPHGQENEPRIEPQYHSGRPGDLLTFRCSPASDQQYSQIVWQRADSDGGQLPYSSRDDGRGQLQFTEARVEDSGSYECRVVDRSGNVGIARATLNITDGAGSAPSVTISPSDRNNVAQGDSIALHCHVSGIPTPTIKWSRLGTPLPSQITQTSTTLQLNNVQMTDRDVYVCLATNVHGNSQASTVIEVEPREAPMVEIHPQTPQTIREGGQTLLQCRLNAGIPNPTITWSRPGGRQLGPNVEEMQGGVLKISQISAADSGTYTCTAENTAGRATATGSIIVQSPPTISISPSGGVHHVVEGREFHIECKAYGTPDPTVQWNRYEGRDRLSYPIRTMSRSTHMAVLEITSATASDSGIYVCLANNAAGAAEERVQLVVNGSYPRRGDITDEDATGDENELHPLPQPGWVQTKDNQYRPALINEKITAPVGTRAELRCSYRSDSGHQLVINWERLDRQPLKASHIVRDGVLYIDDVQPTDAGVYRCYGMNTRTNRVEIDINADLEVTRPPHITLRPPKQVVRPGDSATIECLVSGDQPISVSWQAVQRDMPRSVRVYNDNQLQFHGIEVSDAGRYLCKARNSAGESDAVAEVVVQENAIPSQTVTHTITAHTHEYHLTSGQSARLQCSVDDTSVGVNWRRESHDELPRNSRVLGEGGEVLELLDVQPDDSGRYICETTDGQANADWIQVSVTNRRPTAHVLYPPNFPSNLTSPPSQHPYLSITPSQPQPSHLGDHIDVQCRSSEPGVITTWAKVQPLSRRREDNVQMSGGQLRIRDVRMENAGVWRCEARGRDGRVYSENWTLDVIDSAEKETMPMDVKTVPKGSSIILQCSSNLEPPVVFQWSRQGGGEIPPQINTHMNQLKLQDVSSKDAGIYVCSASSNHRTINTPTVLVVTGILPYFAQAPISFISLPMIPDAYNHFTFEVSIKPQSPDGLILYNGNNRNNKFISLALIDGKPEFKINMGSDVTTLTYPTALDIGKWHTIKVSRNKKKITMYVDGQSPVTVISTSRFSTLDLNEPLYLAGHPALTTLTPVLDVAQGFVGCVSRLKVASNNEYDLIADAYSREGVTTCEECSGGPNGNQCNNGGVCQEELSKEGFKCVCREGYGGKRCERRRGDRDDDVCAPDICGPEGRCIEASPANPRIQCRCPLGRVGPRCQNVIKITDPAFSGEPGSYIAYPTPRSMRHLKLSLTAKPATDSTTGLLVYCAESDEGEGEYVSLSLHRGHVQFRFDAGSGPVTLRSPHPLTADSWHAISAIKTYSEARLVVDGRDMLSEKTVNSNRKLHLQTALYVGGVDDERVTVNQGVGLESGGDGYRGCIKNVTISGMNLDVINSITDSSNVQECSYLDEINEDDDNDDYGQGGRYDNQHNYYPTDYSAQNPVTFRTRETGCSSSPCRNDGQCYPLSPVEYRCNCINGYSGEDCEIAPPLCQQLHPCQNNAPCTGNTTYYKCSCPLRYMGTNCEQPSDLRTDVHMDGDGWLEMPSTLATHTSRASYESLRRSGETVIALEISTNSTSGLLLWYGDSSAGGGSSGGGSWERTGSRGDSGELEVPGHGGSGGDYIALQIIHGYLELSYDLGSGPAVILNDIVNITGNDRHRVIIKLSGRDGSIDVDDNMERGYSEGNSKRLNVNGNIFLGGVPDYESITHGRFHNGFNGCIHGFEINDSKLIEIGAKAINGSNVRPCSSYEGFDSLNEIDETYDDIVN